MCIIYQMMKKTKGFFDFILRQVSVVSRLSNLTIRRPSHSDIFGLSVFVKALQQEYEEMEKMYNPRASVDFSLFQIPGGEDLGKYYNRLNKLGDWVDAVNRSPWKNVYLALDPSDDDAVLGIFALVEDLEGDDYRFDGAISLCVAPEHRCKGVGRYIVNYCRGYFGEMGLKSFEVACDECDILSRTFLEAIRSVSFKKNYKVGPYEMLRYTVDSDCDKYTAFL